MVKIREAIVVEGRYDKNTLSQIVDAPIFETNGFGIFKDKQQMALLRKVAEKRPISESVIKCCISLCITPSLINPSI